MRSIQALLIATFVSLYSFMCCTLVQADYFASIRDSYFDSGNNNIALLSDSGVVLDANFVDPVHLAGPTGMAVVGNSLFVANAFDNTIVKFDATTGAYGGVFADASDGLNGPSALEYRDGNFYVANLGSPATLAFGTDVLKINAASGVASTFKAGLKGPSGLLFDSSGNLFVSEFDAYSGPEFHVTAFDASGAVVLGPLTDSLLAGPTGLAFNADGDLLIAAVNGSRVVRYDGAFSTYVDLSSSSAFPSGIFVTGPNSFWVFDSAFAGLFGYTIDGLGNPQPQGLVASYFNFGYATPPELGLGIGDIVGVPEPSGLMLLSVASLLMLVRRRRRCQ